GPPEGFSPRHPWFPDRLGLLWMVVSVTTTNSVSDADRGALPRCVGAACCLSSAARIDPFDEVPLTASTRARFYHAPLGLPSDFERTPSASKMPTGLLAARSATVRPRGDRSTGRSVEHDPASAEQERAVNEDYRRHRHPLQVPVPVHPRHRWPRPRRPE